MGKIIGLIGNVLFCFKKKQLPEKVNNILIIRSGGIGDVLMTTPLIRTIKSKYPESKIDYLTGNWSKDALEGNKDINEVISFDDEIIFKKKLLKVFGLIKSLKKKEYDLCFVLDKSWHWGVFAYLSNVGFRIGFDRFNEGFANNLNVLYDGSKYELDYYMAIAGLLGIKKADKNMLLYLSEKDKKFGDDFLLNNNLKNKTLIGIAAGGAENPGQKMHVKRWPKEKYIEFVKLILKEKKNAAVLLFGGKNDTALNESIVKETDKIRTYNLAGKTTIKQAAALMRKCKVFVTHDSGTMHMAAAVKVPLIVLFGATNPKRFAPRGSMVIKREVDCSPCYDVYGGYNRNCKSVECMNISAQKVYDALKKVI